MESLVLPLIVGLLVGCVGGLPYPLALAHVRRTHGANILPGFAALGASIVVLLIAIIVCRVVAREVLLPFTLAMAVGFLVMVVVGVVVFMRKTTRS